MRKRVLYGYSILLLTMMRWLTLWLFFAPYIVFSQPGFNRTYDLSFPSGVLVNGITFADKLYLYAALTHDSIPNYYGIGIMVSDTNGIVESIYPLFDKEGLDLATGDNYTMIKTSEGNIALTGGYFGDLSRFLIVFSPKGDLLLYKKISYPYVAYPKELVEVSDGYLMGGGFAPPVDGILRNFVTKVDKQGNIRWRKEYWDKPDWTYLMQSMTKIDDNEIVIGSVQGYTGFGQGHIFAIDSLGNKKWEKIAPAYKENPVFSVTKDPNGNWLYTCSEHPPPAIEGPTWSKVVCRDSAWKLLWERTISPTDWWRNDVLDMKPSPDGDYIVAGRWAPGPSFTEPAWVGGCLSKISPQGELRWTVCDTSDLGLGYQHSDHFVGGLVVLPSGSAVLVGRVDRYKQPARSYGWMFKVDANGCMVEPCSVGAEEAPPALEQLQLWPNPAGERVTVRVPEPVQAEGLDVYDELGRQVISLALAAGQERAELDVSGLPAGVYVCRAVGRSGQALGWGRFVVAR